MKNKKTLVVYYSKSGHTALIAKQISAAAGGDLAEIQLQNPYGKSYLAALLRSALEMLGKKKAELKNSIDVSSYEIIFIGAPVWWFTMPPALLSFLSERDFSGKTLIPFCTQGSNIGKFFINLEKNSNGGKLLGGIDFSSKEFKNPSELQNKLNAWLSQIEKQI